MRKLFILSLVLLFKNAALAFDANFLLRHHANPSIASQELPSKSGAQRVLKFSSMDISRKEFVRAKDDFRRKVLCKASSPGEICHDDRGEIGLLERFSDELQLRAFLGGGYENNIVKLSTLNEGSVKEIPWSGYYWPMYQGGLGNRYADPKFPRSESFKVNYKYYQGHYLKKPTSDVDELAKLSPAEKYDYLISDNQWSLTQAVWTEGKMYQDMYGKVETWFGICHGWAPAAFSVPEPKKAFDIDLKDGKGVMRVYPHDLKGLISQLWAQAQYNYNFLGGRCNDKHPKTDASGRIISSECFDINPSSWHLALTHWVGRNKQSFVLDATYDYEVWNQPISSYRLSYFNPETQKITSLENSIVPYADVKKDPYKKYRSPDTQFIVGVISDIQYVVEEDASHRDSLSDPLERLVTVTYYYDLELDKDYNIIGGEWYQQAHPDMLWKPASGSVASVNGEETLPLWDGLMPLPSEYFNIGVRGSAQKMPLSRILDKLVEWSIGQR